MASISLTVPLLIQIPVVKIYDQVPVFSSSLMGAISLSMTLPGHRSMSATFSYSYSCLHIDRFQFGRDF